MMRSKPSSSLQKTYDECYLICSTAVYFEGHNNEDEALRSWRSALETIHYHNAYRLPAKFIPKTETEKALQESIRQLEIQCRDRVDLLQALHESRKDADGVLKDPNSKKKAAPKLNAASSPSSPGAGPGSGGSPLGWIGEGTIPAVGYMDLSKPPVMPGRPGLPKRSSDSLVNDDTGGGSSNPGSGFQSNSSSSKTKSRGSSPDKRKPMLTTLRNVDPKKQAKKKKKKSILSPRHKDLRPTASKAAGLAWENTARSPSSEKTASEAALVSSRLSVESDSGRKELESKYSGDDLARKTLKGDDHDYIPDLHWRVPDMPPRRTPAMSPRVRPSPAGPPPPESRRASGPLANSPSSPAPASPAIPATGSTFVPMPSPSFSSLSNSNDTIRPPSSPKPSVPQRGQPPYPSPSTKAPKRSSRGLESDPETPSPPRPGRAADPLRKPLANPTPKARVTSPATGKPYPGGNEGLSRSMDKMSISGDSPRRKARSKPRATPSSSDQESSGHKSTDDEEEDDTAVADILNKLPKGVDVQTARQILNDIVVRGDEVHWDDIAGLEAAKKALKEAVVYPFLRPDLFSGLREPARGMLLFGPPGTGKTMLARAVATESKSTFFSVSSSTLTSKWHGESEKLVRALFGLAKALAPSIIFVDEIDSLLSARSTGAEHEASRRSKTEFLVQWSDLQRAAAGREQTTKDKKEGDASRVLVLAATNMPWDIDEAARRRFVRRQYIPLPEHHIRALQIENLLSHQVHELTADDIEVLVQVTEGFSGSDITALAKDAAMGPLRNLGEALLHTPMDQIRPIRFSDFEASLYSIRPSVSQDGLKEYEEWAKKFGERGG